MLDVTWKTEQGEGWTFALLGRSMRLLGIEPRGVLHVGAHHGEELPFYREQGFGTVLLIEPDPASCAVIGPKLLDNEYLLEGAIGAEPGPRQFKRQDHTFLSGLVGRRDREPLDVFDVPSMSLRLVQQHVPAAAACNVLVVDTQGTELEALSSADLDQFDLVIVEAFGLTGLGRPPKVKSAAPEAQLEATMVARGWQRAIRWVYDRSGYYDVLYVPLARPAADGDGAAP